MSPAGLVVDLLVVGQGVSACTPQRIACKCSTQTGHPWLRLPAAAALASNLPVPASQLISLAPAPPLPHTPNQIAFNLTEEPYCAAKQLELQHAIAQEPDQRPQLEPELYSWKQRAEAAQRPGGVTGIPDTFPELDACAVGQLIRGPLLSALESVFGGKRHDQPPSWDIAAGVSIAVGSLLPALQQPASASAGCSNGSRDVRAASDC